MSKMKMLKSWIQTGLEEEQSNNVLCLISFDWNFVKNISLFFEYFYRLDALNEAWTMQNN